MRYAENSLQYTNRLQQLTPLFSHAQNILQEHTRNNVSVHVIHRGPAGLVRRWSWTKKENKKYPPFPADTLAEQPHVHDVAAFYAFLPFHFFQSAFNKNPEEKEKLNFSLPL